MPKEIEFTPYTSRGSDYIRITMSQWSWNYPTQKKVKRFSISPYDLKQALKKAGLYEIVKVPGDDQKALEIAMYTALSTIQSGPNYGLSERGKQARDRLWNRIVKYLDI